MLLSQWPIGMYHFFMVRLSLSRGLIAWYGYRFHVVSLHGTVITLTRSLFTIYYFTIWISLSRGLIAWYGYLSHVVSFHGTGIALA